MEPGHEDREYQAARADAIRIHEPQWSPVMKTGNTGGVTGTPKPSKLASMEPGHEDREYPPATPPAPSEASPPQWSPVMKTGNTRSASTCR